MGSLCLRKSLIHAEWQDTPGGVLFSPCPGFLWLGRFFWVWYGWLLGMGWWARWMFHHLQYKHAEVHMNYCWIYSLVLNSHWRSRREIPQIIQWCILLWKLLCFWINISWVTWEFTVRFLKLHINTFFNTADKSMFTHLKIQIKTCLGA